jgi:hypothetical protein
MTLDGERLAAAINADPEFRIVARHWDARLIIRVGEQPYLLQLRDGEITKFSDRVTLFDQSDIQIAGPAEGWEKVLSEEPPPLYQDLWPAILHGSFTMSGDLESLFAYYPAVRRMWDVIREERANA